jgi:amino-acid N-acetyltransferase
LSITVRVAGVDDAKQLIALLESAGMRSGGVEEHIGQFLIVEAEEDGKLSAVGMVGLEILEGRYGLMRSLVMKNQSWNAQIGVELLRLFVAYAQTLGIERLYLLTRSTTEPFFIHMGFSTARLEEIPPAVALSPHFSACLGEQVIAMVKTYKSTSYPQ